MLLPFRRNASSRLIIVITMILALLLAQGLRVCVHDAATGASDASSWISHLETNLISDDGDGATSSDWHAPFSIVLKQLGIKFELLAVSIALLVLPLLQVVGRLPAPPATAAPLARLHALRPPLRAPPF